MAIASVYIALGGNAGDVVETMERGLSLLGNVAGISVREVSPIYRTAPVGPAVHAPFLNAAARLECTLHPTDLLRELQEIEDRAGRVRGSRWSERSLDLDLLLYDDVVLAEPELMVPHPHMWYRRFVLDPLADIAADVLHPLLNQTVRQLRERLRQKPFVAAIVGGTPSRRRTLSERLRESFPRVTLENISDGSPEDFSEGGGAEPSFVLDLHSKHRAQLAQPSRVVRLADLPGTTFEAAVSVLTAALDEPQRHKRPLRRMP